MSLYIYSGRYTARAKDLRLKSPGDVLRQVFEVDLPLLELQLEGKDLVKVARLSGGGGLLTYCKRDGTQLRSTSNALHDYSSANQKESASEVSCFMLSGSYAHTFNTESGLLRKLAAMRLDIDPFASDARTKVTFFDSKDIWQYAFTK
jgi:hypothetical protein